MNLYSLNAESATYAVESFEPIAKWLTIGIVAALLIAGVALYFAKRTSFPTFVKSAVFGLFCYLLIIGIIFLALEIAKHYSAAYTDENWLDKAMLVRYILIPLCVLAVLTLLSLCAYALASKFAPQAKKVVGYIGIAVFAASLIASLVCIAVYYNQKIADDGYYNSDTASVKQLALYLSVAIVIFLVVGGTFFDKRKLTFDARSLAYAGICVAMSFALSYIKLWAMPQGGSVTLASLLPLMIYSYIFGTKKGVFAGFIYGILQALQDPWLIHPAQFLLDYPVAFAAIGLAGTFAQLPALDKLPQAKFALGGILASAIRYISHVLSGVFAFSAYAEGQNPWVYSLAYNSFVFVDIAIVLVVGVLVFSSRSFVSAIGKINPATTNSKAQ
jgi:thiamine transporter